MEFAIGDIVRSKYGPKLKILDFNWFEDTYYCQVVSDLQVEPMWYDRSELSFIEGAENKSKCECGSKHDRNFPNHHSTWCSEYYDINEGKK